MRNGKIKEKLLRNGDNGSGTRNLGFRFLEVPHGEMGFLKGKF